MFWDVDLFGGITRFGASVSLTVALLVGGAAVSVLIGLVGGVGMAVRPRSLLARALNAVAALALATPPYLICLLVLFLFAADIRALGLPFAGGSGSYRPFAEDPLRWFAAFLMPWLAVAAAPGAILARVLQSELREALQEDFIRTARAKGARPRAIVLRHAPRSALLPTFVAFGLNVTLLVNSAVLVETTFNLPGVERLAARAFRQNDASIIQDIVILNVLFITGVGLLADLAGAWIDPRRRTGRARQLR